MLFRLVEQLVRWLLRVLVRILQRLLSQHRQSLQLGEQQGYTWSYEQANRLSNLEGILTEDIRQVMGQLMDEQVVNGDGSSPNLDGYINHATDPPAADPSDIAKIGDFDGFLAEMVDGLYAYDDTGVRVLMGWKTREFLRKTRISTGDQPTLLSMLPEAQFRASNHVAAPASNVQKLYLHRSEEFRGYAPVWQGVTVVRESLHKGEAG